MKRLLISLASLLCLCSLSQAQFKVGVHVGPTLASGYYSESQMSDQRWLLQGESLLGGAGAGVGTGLEVSYRVPGIKGFDVLFQGDYLYSGLNSDCKSHVDNEIVRGEQDFDNYTYTPARYHNVPLMLGVRYTFPLNSVYGFYGEAFCGLNIRHINSMVVDYSDGSYTNPDGITLNDYRNLKQRDYLNATTFAFRLGAGIMIKDMVSVGASFNRLGSAPVQGSYTRYSCNNIPSPGGVQEFKDVKDFTYAEVNPTMVFISVGYHFNPFKKVRKMILK